MAPSFTPDPVPRSGRPSSVALALALLLPAVSAAAGLLALAAPSGRVPTGTGLVLLLLAALSGLASIGLWRAARRQPDALPRPGPAIDGAPRAGALEAGPDTEGSGEAAAMMSTFSRMLNVVEQRAGDIERYAARLDSAYADIQTSSARLKEFSFKDEVTGLYNRRFFSIRLEEEVSRYRRFNHPVSVVLLDLDSFKAVNDELGHGAGDETLRGVAEVLMRNSRGINVICRYGGDEFAILLVETSKTGARLYADRIRYVLPGHRFAHGRRVTASFGIASVPEDVAPSADDLIRAADEALYAAKRAGKNRVSVYESLDSSGRGPSRDGH